MHTTVLATALIVSHVIRESLGWWMPFGPVRDDALRRTLERLDQHQCRPCWDACCYLSEQAQMPVAVFVMPVGT